MSLPNSRYPIANSHYFLFHAFNPFRHRRNPPVDRRCRKARHSSGAAGRDGDRRPNRRLPLRWQDRSADRARAPGTGRTPGVPRGRQNHRGVPALCRSAHCRAREAHADNQALSRDQRAARGAGALRSRRPRARRPAHGQRPERRGAEAALGGPRSGAVRGRRVRLRLTRPSGIAGGRGTAGGRAHGPAVYRSRPGRGGRHTRRRRMRPPDGSSHRWGRDGILRHGGAPGCGCDPRVPEPGRHASGAASPVLVTVVREELELKARVENADAVRRSILAAGAELVYRGAMMDRRFDRKGRLERRDEVVRLRVYHPADKSPEWGVLGWKGPVQLRGEYRMREEWESRVDDPKAVLVILRHMGYKISLRVDRAVEQYRLGDATLRLEWYPAMDVLLEVEGEPDAIERAVTATGLARDAFLPESLPYFTAAYEKRTGRVARVSRLRRRE